MPYICAKDRKAVEDFRAAHPHVYAWILDDLDAYWHPVSIAGKEWACDAVTESIVRLIARVNRIYPEPWWYRLPREPYKTAQRRERREDWWKELSDCPVCGVMHDATRSNRVHRVKRPHWVNYHWHYGGRGHVGSMDCCTNDDCAAVVDVARRCTTKDLYACGVLVKDSTPLFRAAARFATETETATC